MLNMIHQLGDKTVIRDGHNWIADSAKVIGNIHLKNGNVWFGAVLRGDIEKITLGEGSNIQDNSVIHTDPGCPSEYWIRRHYRSFSNVARVYN